MIRTRFAPSPTGELHIGGARTALFNLLYARSEPDGCFVLRIDDTDPERSKKEYESKLFFDLKWLGLEWDEGPYRQSERGEIYSYWLGELKKRGAVYPCFCSDERLSSMREEQLSRGEPPMYDGKCRDISHEEAEERIKSGEKPCWRLKLPLNYSVDFNDVIRGNQNFPAGTIGDFVIQRSDGTPTYIFASAVDDYLMNITHIIRGDEHIPNTARQLVIIDIMGWERPVFAHIPMVLSSERRKLGKRTGSTPIREYREQGFLPSAVDAYLATLSWAPDEKADLLNLKSMAKFFRLEKIVRSSPVHDETHLLFWQKKAMSQIPPEKIAKELIESEPGLEVYREKLPDLLKEILGEHAFVKNIDEALKFLLEPPKKLELNNSWSKSLAEGLLKIFDWNASSIEKFLRTFMKENNLKGRDFFHPLRMILTGQEHGAPLPVIMFVLGRENCVERLMGD